MGVCMGVYNEWIDILNVWIWNRSNVWMLGMYGCLQCIECNFPQRGHKSVALPCQLGQAVEAVVCKVIG